MSQWSASQSHQAGRGQHHAREAARRADSRHHPVSQPARSAGYTIAHKGRQIRFGPVAFWIAVGTVVIMAGWSIMTATYFAFRDDVLRELIAHQSEQQYAYEDRIAELRTQIDRTTSRQLLDQEQFEQKLDDLMRRQSTLESRASVLGGLADPITTGSIKTSPPQRPDRGSMLEPSREPAARKGAKDADISVKLGRLEASLDRIERRESSALAQLQDRYESKVRKERGVLADLGVKLSTTTAASGGPFVPVRVPAESQSFERALTRVSIARAESERLDATLVGVPVRIPVAGDIDITSNFGVRVDPFLHVPALHTGLDFRGEMGEPVHATAAGTVTNAGWSGGYGRMIEIDHGNGLATRYGHLSEIDVVVGQRIRVGQVIGKIGSTGRSTGPHLHYETRVDGEAVNPEKFLSAGAKLFGQPDVARNQRGDVRD